MGRRSSQLKALANIAKKRLMNGDYKEVETKTQFVPKVSNYFLKNARALKKLNAKIEYVKIDSKINGDFERQVEEILVNDCELTPLAKLVDYKIYNALTEAEKQSYILKIAEQYNYLKEVYNKKESEAI